MVGRLGSCALLAAALLTAPAAAAEAPGAPAPELPAPVGAAPEGAVDALPPEDSRRPALLLDLALAQHAEAEAIEAEERGAQAEALARWRAAPPRSPAPAHATPRGDVRRAEALRLAERALEEAEGLPAFPRAPEALLVAGIDADHIGRGRDALRWLGRLVRRHPDSPLAAEGWLALGEHHLREGDLTLARAAFEAAAKGGRPALRAWSEVRLVEVALGATDPDGALAALRRGLSARSPAALATLDRLAASPERLPFGAPALLALADLLEASGAPARALAVRERALRSPAAGPTLGRARADLERTRRLAAATPLRAAPAAFLEGRVALLRATVSAEPAPASPRLAAFGGDPAALHALAREALAEGRAGEARLLLDRALAAAATPAAEEAALRNDRAAALWALGGADAARAELGRALALAPDLVPALENAGLAALAARDAARAEPLLARAVAAEPGGWRARLLLARALAELGRPAEALAQAERVLELARGQADALQLAVGLREAQAETGEADPRLRSRSSL